MKPKKGFTIIELVTAVAVVALLLSLLLPSLNMAKNMAREAKQKVQFSAIDQALLAWRNDFGDYPPSNWDPTETQTLYYCGAQKLAEALVGRDLLGFHAESVFRYDGLDETGMFNLYPLNPDAVNLSNRKLRYLELEALDVFRIRDVFQNDSWKLNPDTYVFCDVFGRYKVVSGKDIVRAGMPVLYYRADTSKIDFGGDPMNSIYNSFDNFHIVFAAQQNDPSRIHPLAEVNNKFLYDPRYKVKDPKVVRPWPHRPDSYILISAGVDGLYGTNDDITNFGY